MRNEIRGKIKHIFKGKLQEDKWIIHFGYDCIGIEVDKTQGIYSNLLKEFEEEFNSESTYIYLNKRGNFVFMYDISHIILNEFGEWSIYEKAYGIV